MAGPVVIVNLLSIGLYCLFYVFWIPTLRESFSNAGRANSELNGFVLETANTLRTLKSVCAEDVWYERARAHSARTASARARVAMRESFTHSLTQLLTALTVIGVATLGTLQIMNDQMSVGALIAVTALSWRILGPLNAAFGAMAKLNSTRLSIRQINALMDLKEEQGEGAIFVRPTEIRGDISFNRVSFPVLSAGRTRATGCNTANQGR